MAADEEIEITVYIPQVEPDIQVRNVLSKVAFTLDISSRPEASIDAKIDAIDISLAYLLRLRAQLLVRRMMVRLKTNRAKKTW